VILAVDVGGTNTRLALLDAEIAGPQLRVFEKVSSRAHPSLEQIIETFLAAHPGKIDAACVGVAGHVREGRAVVTNLAWAADSGELSKRLPVPEVGLINDIQANAWGIPALSAGDFLELNPGRVVPMGTGALISAGTGLGQAGVVWSGTEYCPIPSEGGHADFAPRNRLEIELLEYLLHKFGGRVSYERTLSGPGLVNIYSFLRDSGKAEEPEWLKKRLDTGGDQAAEIARAAAECALADYALEIFASIYGAAAGNVALHFMATAGVYIGGGIAPKIAHKLQGKTFLSAFLDKGRLSPMLALMPVKIIMNDKTALLGAARWAWRWMKANAMV
jgi:glucokinase